jgi:peptidoglycan hydrolase-like protein with peptidoglycan-binding domain
VRADQTIQSVQQALKDQGFYYGEATGDKSAETTAAIRRYQIRNGLQVSGEINPETLRSLNLSSKSASSSQGASKSGVTQSNAVHRDDNSRVDQNSPPRSASAPDRRLEMTPGFFGPPYPAAPPRLSGRMIIAEVQRQLMNRGYYRGRIDGRYGPRTAFAMRAFQSGSGLPPTGHLDPSTLGALGLADSNLAYLESAPQLHEGRVPVWKFKHGKWKLKWKKLHRHKGDKYGDEDEGWNGDDLWHGEDHDD